MNWGVDSGVVGRRWSGNRIEQCHGGVGDGDENALLLLLFVGAGCAWCVVMW